MNPYPEQFVFNLVSHVDYNIFNILITLLFWIAISRFIDKYTERLMVRSFERIAPEGQLKQGEFQDVMLNRLLKSSCFFMVYLGITYFGTLLGHFEFGTVLLQIGFIGVLCQKVGVACRSAYVMRKSIGVVNASSRVTESFKRQVNEIYRLGLVLIMFTVTLAIPGLLLLINFSNVLPYIL